MSTGQADFARALLDARLPVPADLGDGRGGPAGRRFDIYRNTVAVSLREALETGFPVLRKLVGAEFFAAMAGVFLRAHPPEDPRLQLYGGRLPGFLEGFAPCAHLPYLPDIARLELGLRQSYHAADAAPLVVTGLEPGAVLALRPQVAPATLVVRSRHPILDIWHYNMTPEAPRPGAGGQDVVITRPGFDPGPHLLPRGGVAMLRRLKGRLTLAEVMTETLAEEPAADLPALMQVLTTSGALTLERTTP